MCVRVYKEEIEEKRFNREEICLTFDEKEKEISRKVKLEIYAKTYPILNPCINDNTGL